MSPILIPLTAILLPVFLAPTLVVLKQRHQKRHWQHLERMRAIAAGVPAPPSNAPPSPLGVIAIGAGVPAVAILAALVVTLNLGYVSPHALEQTAIIWGSALMISLGAMPSSLVLFVLQNRAHARTTTDAASSYAQAIYDSAKPAYDPDTFDVAGRRG